MAKSEKNKFLARLVDKGGDIIANRVFIRPSIDRMKGDMADERRQKILRRRESIRNDKAMGY